MRKWPRLHRLACTHGHSNELACSLTERQAYKSLSYIAGGLPQKTEPWHTAAQSIPVAPNKRSSIHHREA
ncbi:MAG: hypothetical protein J2P49_02365, partial [Methylocapsa sp.]|nr:hypothetical protein [Methylocapsa sp.]